MEMIFEWDDSKAKSNLRKHDIAFEEAIACFYDPCGSAFDDPEHSKTEHREILIGHSKTGKLLVVVYVIREESIRIISARSATKKEAQNYEKRI
jgi:uncharacterized DUF497 family protein